MIVLGAESELSRNEVAEGVAEALDHLHGGITSTEESDDAVRFHFFIPALGLPSLGAYLASTGLLLDPESDQELGGISAGVHFTTVNGTLLVRLAAESL